MSGIMQSFCFFILGWCLALVYERALPGKGLGWRPWALVGAAYGVIGFIIHLAL